MIVADERVARFVSERLNFALCPPYSVVGMERDGKIIAGVLINHFEGHDCHISVAGTGWTRSFLEAVGEYVFEGLGCLRMTFITEQPHVISLAERLGGKIEGCMRDHFGECRDGIIIGCLRNEWKYRTIKH